MDEAQLSEQQLEALANVYTLRDEQEVRHMLRKYPYLFPILEEARVEIASYFPEAHIFPDAGWDHTTVMGDNEELIVSIRSQLAPQEAVKTLRQFYNDWWLDISKQARGRITVGVECS